MRGSFVFRKLGLRVASGSAPKEIGHSPFIPFVSALVIAAFVSPMVTQASQQVACASEKSTPSEKMPTAKEGEASQSFQQKIYDGCGGDAGTFDRKVTDDVHKFLLAQGVSNYGLLSLVDEGDLNNIPASDLALGAKSALRSLLKAVRPSTGTIVKPCAAVDLTGTVDPEALTFEQGLQLMAEGRLQTDSVDVKEQAPYDIYGTPHLLPPKAAIAHARRSLLKGLKFNDPVFPTEPISRIFAPSWAQTMVSKGQTIWSNFSGYLAAWETWGFVVQCRWADCGPIIGTGDFRILTHMLHLICNFEGPNMAILYVDEVRKIIGHNLAHGVAFDLTKYISTMQEDVLKNIRTKLNNGLVQYPLQTMGPGKGKAKGDYPPKGKGTGKGLGSAATGLLRPGAWEYCRANGICGYFADHAYCGYTQKGGCSFQHVSAAEIHRRMDGKNREAHAPTREKKEKKRRSRSRSRSRRRQR